MLEVSPLSLLILIFGQIRITNQSIETVIEFPQEARVKAKCCFSLIEQGSLLKDTKFKESEEILYIWAFNTNYVNLLSAYIFC